MMQHNRGWGSRPVDGRDWGTSYGYEKSVLDDLLAQFKEASLLEGVFDFMISDVLCCR
jgi:hypothetical protein